MNPFFFGTRERRLFGLYFAGSGGGSRQRAVVLCHPFGQEYLRAHRSLNHLGHLLWRAGLHVLRFDWFGTGDSAGDLADGDLEGWRADLDAAIDELRDTAGVERVGLAGLRLGATLAATVAARRPADVDGLVLWDPVVTGAEYVAELERSATRPDPAAPREVLGFIVPDRLFAELGGVDLLPAVPDLPEPTRVVITQALPSHVELRARLGARPRPAAVDELECPPVWLKERSGGPGALPVDVLQRIASTWEVAR